MKKRLFAGALALLMIIGLLSVSSMLKKPVEAQAADKIEVHTVNEFESGNKYSKFSDTFFTVNNGPITAGSYASKVGLKMDGNNKSVAFSISGDRAIVEIEWSSSTDGKIGIKETEKNISKEDTIAASKKIQTSIFEITESGNYEIARAYSKSTYIYRITVKVPVYTINVDDPLLEGQPSTKEVYEGREFTLEASGENFLYWKNSTGRIVSRRKSETLKAYYNETYTAVYGSDATVYYMTAYDQIYKSVASDAFDSSSEPAGPIRYGYKFKGWNMSASDIQAEIKSGTTKKIFVEPQYDQDTTTKYTVTVDTIALTGGKSVDTEYTINDVATASTSSAEFAYWKDAETGKVLSYNSTYYFFANKPMKVVAVKKSDDVISEGVISLVYNGTDENGNSVVIFEYTVPSDCTVKFAGVYASPDKGNLTASAEFVGGDTFNSKETYKYTMYPFLLS